MKNCISKIKLWFVNLWRTVVSTFVKKHKPEILIRDVDEDNVPEIIIDLNGDNTTQCTDVEKEE